MFFECNRNLVDLVGASPVFPSMSPNSCVALFSDKHTSSISRCVLCAGHAIAYGAGQSADSVARGPE